MSGEPFKTILNMHRLKKTQRLHRRLDDYDAKKYSVKRNKLRDQLFLGEKVFIIAKRVKKKSAPVKFYKQLVQNISYFNKEKTFIMREIQSTGVIKYY